MSDQPKVRLVGLAVHLELVVDDGTVLDPLPVQPIQIAARDWATWRIEDVLAQAQAQIADQ